MSLSLADIKKLSELSRLELSEGELLQMQHDLDQVVQYVSKLQSVDIDGVLPMTHAIPMELRRREDVFIEGVGREGLLGSEGYEDGLVKVPKIIE